MAMDGSKAELKVGLTVLAAIAIFVFALLWVKGTRISHETQVLQVWFPNVGSLEIGDPVSVSGVRRGKVQSVLLSRGGVTVGMQVAKDVDLRADAVISIKNMGLMGQRFIDIKTGTSSDPWPADSVPIGVYETGIPEVMGVMGRVTEEIGELVRAIRSTIGSDQTLERLVIVSQNLEKLSEQTATMVENNRTGIAQAIEDLSVAARDLRQIVSTSEGAITRTTDRFDSAAVKLNNFVDRLDTLSSNIHQLVQNVNSGDGSLARLIHDDQLIRRWEATATELDDLISDIRANPQKYLNVKVRLF